MFCPRCGVKNVDDAKFCRACGSDISLVPQALTRSLPEGAFGVVNITEEEKQGRKKRKYKFKEPPTLEKGLSKCMEGLAYLIICFIGFRYFFGAIFLCIWFIIPALSTFGEGVGQIIRSRSDRGALHPHTPLHPDDFLPAPAHAADELTPRATAEIPPTPLSVTEGTTRHLDAARPAKH